jgi:Xaa-Pro aminopeptidase
MARLIARLLDAEGVSRVRVEPDFPLGLARALETNDVDVACDGPIFADARRAKQPHEVAAIRESQAAAQSAMSAARHLLGNAEVREGKLYHAGAPLTSQVLISAIEKDLLDAGCGIDGTIAAGGALSADPHARDSGHLEAGAPVILDIFPQNKSTRYFGDMTRTFVVGEPSETWLKMYDATHRAYTAALAAVKAGVNGRDVHLAAVKELYDAGFGSLVEGYKREGVPAMIHGTGHGVGLEIHEAPRVSDSNNELRAGDVITIEPGLYHPDHGGVRIEDTVVVTADGYENLTDYAVDWRP